MAYGSANVQSPNNLTPLSDLSNPLGARPDERQDPVPVFAERASQVGRHGRGMKGSILREEFVEQIQSVTGRAQARALATAVILQSTAFLMLVVFSGVSPMLKQALMNRDPETGKRTAEYLKPMPYVVDFAISIVLGNLVSFFMSGTQGLKDCWNLNAILRFCPVMIFASMSEMLQMYILEDLDGTAWRIIKQMKLPFTAVGVYVLLGRRNTSPVQWTLIASVSVAVAGYCCASGVKPDSNFSWTGVVKAITSIVLTTIGGIFGDYTYKAVKFPMYSQMAQGRLTSLVVGITFATSMAFYRGETHKLYFGGYSWGVLALSPWLVLKDWTGSFVLKHLDSVWKALAGVLSVVVAYVLDMAFNGKVFAPVAFCFLSGVMINVLAYALAKRDQAIIASLEGKNAAKSV